MKYWLVLFAFGFSTFASVGATALSIPALTGPVMDEAHLLSDSTKSQLSNLLRQVHETGKAQIQILTLESLEGGSLEQLSIEITDKWKLGDQKKDNGVLFLIVKNDHKVRIEVGQGLEGELPDIYVGRIIRQVVSPLFKAGQFDEGIVRGTFQIIQKIAPELAGETREIAPAQEHRRGNKKELPAMVIFILIIIMLARLGGGRGFGGGFWGGGGFGGGGFGGGGFGGGSSGGWSGGGGGFSGGGASGDW